MAKFIFLLSTCAFAATLQQHNHAINNLIDPLFNSDKDLIPAAVRFGYHSCFGHGCNGCIDLENRGNLGLEKIFDLLNGLYDNDEDEANKISMSMSRADFWALAAWRATIRALPKDEEGGNAGLAEEISKKYPFKFGRKDCSTSPLPDWDLTTVQFPDEKLGVDEILRAFGPKSLFNFSQKDCVALIAGGHSIGRGHLNSTGYEGVWDDSPDTIDNLFVKEMVEESFTQIQNPAGKWQFYNDDNVPRSEDPTLFFNTDMSLVRRLERTEEAIENGMGKVTENCNKIDNSAADKTSKCPFSRLFSQTKYYADSDTKVLVRDFTRVYRVV